MAIWAGLQRRRLDAPVVGALCAGSLAGSLASWVDGAQFDTLLYLSAAMVLIGIVGAAALNVVSALLNSAAACCGVLIGFASEMGADGLHPALFALGAAIASASVASYGFIAIAPSCPDWIKIALRAGSELDFGDRTHGFRIGVVPAARRQVMRRLLLAVLALVFSAAFANAHLASDSYLRIELDAKGEVNGQWDIALRDLDAAVGLDAGGDGLVTWGKLKAKRSAIEAYAFKPLSLGGCVLHPSEFLVDYHAGNAYAAIRFRADCAQASGPRT